MPVFVQAQLNWNQATRSVVTGRATSRALRTVRRSEFLLAYYVLHATLAAPTVTT